MAKAKDKLTIQRVTKWRKSLTHDEVVSILRDESPIDNELAKTIMCESIATCRKALNELSAKQEAGTIKAEERRVIPALVSNMGRLLEKLKTLEPPLEKFDI